LAVGGDKVEEAAFGGQHLGGRPPPCVPLERDGGVASVEVAGGRPLRIEGDDVRRREEGVGEGDDLLYLAAAGEPVADGFEHLGRPEGGAAGGEPLRGRQLPEQPIGGRSTRGRRCCRVGTVEGGGEDTVVESVVLGLGPPAVKEVLGLGVGVLAFRVA